MTEAPQGISFPIWTGALVLFSATAFAGAFLLFLVQPIIAKLILPWFGGAAAVWTICMLFFQVLLTCGYAYADWISRRLCGRNQARLHAALLALSLLWLPIVPGAIWRPSGSEEPSFLILGLLVASVGFPYFMLSTTAPLVQAWFARLYASRDVYRLYSVSNAGSLIALLAYPVAIEPWLPTRSQGLAWSAGYVLFAVLCATLAIRVGFKALPAERIARSVNEGVRPSLAHYALWVWLSALGSLLLLSVTSHLTQNVASVPLLWILPLAIYLLTFILCFDTRSGRVRWYRQRVFVGLSLVAAAAMALALGSLSAKAGVLIYGAGLFLCCMFLHGELALRRPAADYLTGFYLAISVGGALGGVFAGLIAPRIFDWYAELAIALGGCALTALYVAEGEFLSLRARGAGRFQKVAGAAMVAFAVLWCILTAVVLVAYGQVVYTDRIAMERNFYGVLTVREKGASSPEKPKRQLVHGTIIHGEQFLDPERRMVPTSYFGPSSGIGRVFRAMQEPELRVGVIGLGVGTLLAYGRQGDAFRFYEINPDALALARAHFFYLGSTPARHETVLGDGRLSLAREEPQGFDILVIDAFSGDSIPMHLVTREALEIYSRHINSDGVIAFHITNRFVDLSPVIERIGSEAGMRSVLVTDRPETESGVYPSDWMILTRNAEFLDREPIASVARAVPSRPESRLWTDDYSNLLGVLK